MTLTMTNTLLTSWLRQHLNMDLHHELTMRWKDNTDVLLHPCSASTVRTPFRTILPPVKKMIFLSFPIDYFSKKDDDDGRLKSLKDKRLSFIISVLNQCKS